MKAICKEKNDRNFIIECSNNEQYELPIFVYDNYNFKIGEELHGEILFDKRKQKNSFEPNHPEYNIGETLDFPIIDFKTIYDKEYFIVRDCFNNEIRVNPLKWQDRNNIKSDNLKCQIVKIWHGKPVLKNVDYKHHIYEIEKEYDFEFIGIETKTLSDGRLFDVIKLKGEDGITHETPPLPSQYGHKFKPKTIRCKIVGISSYIKLEQTSNIDPYFSKIEEIVDIDSQVLKKYFFDLSGDDKYKELLAQYESNSSLWTITYCNKILPELIISAANNFNFKESIIIIEILLKVENWILKSGLLDSFKKEETKTQIKISSERFIDKFSLMKSTFGFILKNKFDLSNLTSTREKTFSLAYYLRFNKKELIDYSKLFQYLIELIKELKTEEIGKFEVKYLIDQIELQKYNLKNDEIEKDFTIGEHSRLPFNSHDDLNLYLKYTIIQAYLSEKDLRKNIYMGDFYKYLSFHFIADLDKKNSLKIAYQLIKSTECCLEFDTDYLNDIDNLENLSNSFNSSYSEFLTSTDKEEWIEIQKIFKEDSTITINLKQRTVYGYTGYYKNIYCILPITHINSTALKHYNESVCDIFINVSIQNTYYNFGSIVVKELPTNHKEHKIENVLIKELNVGDVVNARVKNIEKFGIFLTTYAGEGLLLLKNISDLFINVNNLNSIFRIGQELKVCILEKTEDDKLEFGLKQLKGTEFEDDLDEIELKIYTPNFPSKSASINEVVTIDTDLNKQLYILGHLFEYFSNLQYDFIGKIKYLKLSKIFYSALLSSRSYFLNTYISYFDILNDIEESLEKKSDKLIENIISKAETLHAQLEKNTKSIETFPSIYRLIFFLDIIKQFNKTSNESIRNLTEYLLEDKYNKYPVLNKVAKVVLSNNLIISEKSEADFMFKNLRILFQYLKEGVFDLSENEHERREREIKERISSIRNKIFNEESEIVEFKTSLIKPVLDAPRLKQLQNLEKFNDQKSKNEIANLIGKPAKNRVIHSAMKTLVAFANSKGGTLFIGINDDGEFIGLEHDYDEIRKTSRDELGKKLDDFIKNYIGNSFFGIVSIKFESIDKKDILIIEVNSSEDEVFLLKDENGADTSDFYIRRHSSSVKLQGKELIEYYKWRYKKPSA